MTNRPRHRSPVAGFLFLGACVRPADDTDVVPTLSPPTIATFEWSCDADAAEWTLAVENTSWSGGGALWLTVDGRYVETHAVRVDRQEPDGSGETMALALAIEADWRDVAPGASTAFLCAEAPAMRFLLEDPEGEPADCRTQGDPAVWSTVPEAPPCDTP